MDIQKAVSDLLGTGLTQAQLAGQIPCSQSLVSALLSGKRGERVSYVIASRIAELYAQKVQPELLGDKSRHRSSADAARDSEGAKIEECAGGASGDDE
ncbi:helix-turn-helix transcriptional regulator [Pandoraea pnomenusa]|uniref:helix-turn-helix domain-containing protein n=1 Tax=Pandoraea pnomenusa TaxID=93220 RepID=UPI00334221AC